MRFHIVLSVNVLAILAAPPLAGAQGEPRIGDAESMPYHKHHDTKNGHDHSYPDRGAIVREVPKGAVVVNYAGIAYRFSDGIWFEPHGPAFMVVAPPIGLIVPTLPTFSSVIARSGKLFLYSNDTYYVPRPDVGGYEVVNDPSEATADGGNAAAGIASGAAPLAAEAVAAGAAASPQVFATPLLESAAAQPVEKAAAPTIISPSAAAATAAGAPLAVAGAAPLAAGSSMAAGSTLASVAAPTAATAVIYPKNGQSADQQARDRYECYRFGVAQSGFDPMHPSSLSAAARADGQTSYERAQGVCLDAHGYAVH
jgi:hypothetical protein